jgi:hypothetical protein
MRPKSLRSIYRIYSLPLLTSKYLHVWTRAILTTASIANNFLFAHQTNILADEEKAATLRNNSYSLIMGINLNKHFPFIPDFLESLPLSISKPIMPPGLIDLLDLFEVSL